MPYDIYAGSMCVEMGKKGGLSSMPCSIKSAGQLFRLENLPYSEFKGKRNSDNEIGVYRYVAGHCTCTCNLPLLTPKFTGSGS